MSAHKGESPMRLLSLAFSFLVALLFMALVLVYLPRQVGQQRIYLQDQFLSYSSAR
jgi:hypothetical protein